MTLCPHQYANHLVRQMILQENASCSFQNISLDVWGSQLVKVRAIIQGVPDH